LIQFPFESPDIIRYDFDSVEQGASEIPLLQIFSLLIESLGEKGLKPTATGNLPRKVCRSIAQTYMDEQAYAEYTEYGEINSEDDFLDLKKVRLTAERARLIRTNGGRIIVSKDGKKMYADSKWSELYFIFFTSFIKILIPVSS